MEGASEDDRRLIEAFLQGDPSALRRVDGWIDVVLLQDFHSVRQEWKDLRQEVRIRVLRNLGKGAFNGRSAFRTYVHRIAKNVCIDLTRMAYRRRERSAESGPAPPDREDASSPLAGWMARDFLQKLLEGLTDEDRTLVRMVFGEHFSYQEIASKLGIPEGTVKSRMARCKERILRRRRELSGEAE